MSDDQSDSWRFLADELGVDPDKQITSPSVPSTNQPAAKHQSPPSSGSAPPKKSKADWNALAGELGLEVPQQSDSDSAHDHVAELLGFPPPGSFSSQHDEPQSRDQGEEDYRDQYSKESERSSDRDRWRDEDEKQRRGNMYDDTKPVYEDAHSADYEEPQPPADYRDPPHAGAEQNYRSGGRRRGGRGRGGDRGGESRGRYGNQNRQRDSYGNRPYGQQDSDRPPQFDEYAGEERSSFSEGPGESSGNERGGNEHGGDERSGNERSSNERIGNERSGDDRSRRRRRRGGRGRGGRSDRPQQRPPMNREQSNRPVGDHDLPYLDPIDESLLGDDHGALAEFESVDFSADEAALRSGPNRFDDATGRAVDSTSRMDDHDDEHDDHDLAALDDDSHDENNIGKASVRDILTWKEAIGMIVDGNMQSRANSPHPPQHSRGQRGGRGRGRGRGGHRR
jgi:hypothetical protein